MKKYLTVIVSAMLTLMSAWGAVSDGTPTNSNFGQPETGYDFISDGIYYKIRTTAQPEVTTSEGDKPYSGDIAIPDEVIHQGKTYKVTKVSGFVNSPDVTAITVPRYCRKITALYGGKYVNTVVKFAPGKPHRSNSSSPEPKLRKVRFNAEKCDTAYYDSSYVHPLGGWAYVIYQEIFPSTVTEVSFGDKVSSIPDQLLASCGKLTELTFPESVTIIGKKIIEKESDNIVRLTLNCRDLQLLSWHPQKEDAIVVGPEFHTFPKGFLTEDTLSSLTEFTFPEWTQKIAYDAFLNCHTLQSVTLPEGVKSIGTGAFFGCENLSSVSLSNSLVEVATQAFYGCAKLETVTLPSSLKVVGVEAFYNLKECTLPESIISIGRNAFRSLTAVSVPKGVRHIGVSAFYNARNVTWNAAGYEGENGMSPFSESLSSVTLGPDVKSIPKYVFRGTYIRSIIIPENVKSIDFTAFHESQLNTMVVNGNPARIISNYNVATVPLVNVIFGPKATSVKERFLSGMTSLTNVTLSSSITEIGDGAFEGCKKLASIELPESLQSIGEFAFYECNALPEITIPSSVKTVSGYAFYNCAGLEKMTIDAEEISSSAIYNCENLKEVVLGSNVKSLDGSFRSCDKLEKVIVSGNPEGMFGNRYEDSNIKEIILTDDVTSVYEHLFSSSPVEKIQFGANVRELGAYAFEDAQMPVVEIPESLEFYGNSIGLEKTVKILWDAIAPNDKALSSNNGWNISARAQQAPLLSSIVIGENVEYMPYISMDRSIPEFIINSRNIKGNYVPNAQASIIFGPEVESIDGLFTYHNTLQTIKFPSTLKYIGESEFQSENFLTVLCGSMTPPQISNNTFNHVTKVSSTLFVPVGTKSLYESATGWREFENIRESPELGNAAIDDLQINGENGLYEINGNIFLSNHTSVSVSNIYGQEIFTGKGPIALPAGIYVIKSPGIATKKIQIL